MLIKSKTRQTHCLGLKDQPQIKVIDTCGLMDLFNEETHNLDNLKEDLQQIREIAQLHRAILCYL